MLTKLSPELLHNVTAYLDTEGLQALNRVCRQMRAHNIDRALRSIGSQYAAPGYEPATAALQLADALNVAWQKRLEVILLSTDYNMIGSYYTAMGHGGWVMLDWLIKLLQRELVACRTGFTGHELEALHIGKLVMDTSRASSSQKLRVEDRLQPARVFTMIDDRGF
ncbi:hypothetical protein FN846DRAFT_902255 [Sphaerosporella brunnea]|uniref:F-box domain-containing protein n=1 Tax=Sphaerosporella brunnea TaxID=1250544 RepID=A0A5J5FAK3_9PEZI|nr:hypothetical protein FN846DRAFT_902255 [Sphaerosporella brunnea]